jgi:hypothetical protein
LEEAEVCPSQYDAVMGVVGCEQFVGGGSLQYLLWWGALS